MTLSDIAIRRPVFTTVVTMGLMVLGAMSLRNIGTDLFPDVNFPIVTVQTIYPGASPAEVESQLTRPIEDAVAGINGLETVRSFSRESVSVVVVLFKLSANIDVAAQDVRDRIAGVRLKLPTDIREPTIRRVDIGAAPVMSYLVNADVPPEEIRRVTEDLIKPNLERAPGVAAIEVNGGRDREILVEVDPRKLDALYLPLTAVADRLKYENLNVPAGNFNEGPQEVSVRLEGDMRSAAEVGQITLMTTQAGTQVRVADVANVRDGFADQRQTIRANGKFAVAFDVIKQSGTNTVEVTDGVKQRLDPILKQLPAGYSLNVLFDQSIFVRESTHEVEVSIVYGGLMAILIILVFMLDMRSTIISALALPTSVVTTFFFMDLMGYTLNMMTLLGLSLAIGLLIDDAVVVRESIFRHLESGEDPVTAASKGTQEIALAVLATTLTIVAVFVPVAFMKGLVGQFFRQFGLTVSAATLVSLFIAFTLDPMLSAKFAAKVDHARKRFVLVRAMEAMHGAMEELYLSILRFATRWKALTVLVGVLVFAGSLRLAGLMGNEFMAAEDRGQFLVNIELPAGTSLDETARLTLPGELALLENGSFVTVYAKLGADNETNKAQWRIVGVPKRERTDTQKDMEAFARRTALGIPGAKVSVDPPAFIEGLPSGAPLQVQVRGNDPVRLEQNAAAVKQMLEQIPGLIDIRMVYTPGKPEQTVRVDRERAGELGVPVALVARTLRAAVEGEEAGKLRTEGLQSRDVRIRVRLQPGDRSSVDRLADITVPTPKGLVPLSTLAKIEPSTGPQVIERQDRTRQISVNALMAGRSMSEVLADLQPKLDAYDFGPKGYYVLEGMVKQFKEMGEALGLALALAVLFIFLILAAQFESFIHPLTIMLSLPLAFVGAFIALFIADTPMSMGANIGIILLMGLVTKNAILLVDAALQRQREGWSAQDAIVDAGRKRLRPILMTSAAMVLGMLPTAILQGDGSEFRAPMAIAVIGGVITSTMLTLLVVPAVFLWFDAARRLFARIGPQRTSAADLSRAGANTLALVLALGIALTPLHARAEGALTLDDAITRTLKRNRDIGAMRARILEAETGRKRVRTAWYPDVKAVGQYTHNSVEAVFDTGAFIKQLTSFFPPNAFPAGLTSNLPPPTIIQRQDTFSAVLTFDQTLFALSPLIADEAVAHGVEAQRGALDAIRRELAFRVAEVFYHVAGLERIIAAAERASGVADQRITLALARRKEGTDTELPLLRAQLEKTKADQDVSQAQLGRRQLLDVLGLLMDETPPDAIVAPPEVKVPAESLDALLVQGAKARPDITARHKAVAAAERLVREAELRWIPIVAANGYVRWSDTPGFVGKNWTWALTGNLVVPLFDRGVRYVDLEERRAAVIRLREELGKSEGELRAALRQADNEIKTARVALRTAQEQVRVARRSAEIVQKAYAAGAVTSLDTAEADAGLRLSEAALAREQARLDLAVLKLRHAAGLVRPP